MLFCYQSQSYLCIVYVFVYIPLIDIIYYFHFQSKTIIWFIATISKEFGTVMFPRIYEFNSSPFTILQIHVHSLEVMNSESVFIRFQWKKKSKIQKYKFLLNFN